MPARNRGSRKIRAEIAQLAARFVAVEGVNDYLTAKKKAALQLGVNQNKYLPTNVEIEQSLIDYQRLFQADTHPQHIRSLRKKAVDAMRFLYDFDPRLVGSVLGGTATEYSEIILHLFTDDTDQVSLFLADHGIPFTCTDKAVKKRMNDIAKYPAIRFLVENSTITLVIFPEVQKFSAPLCPINSRPMQRASITDVIKLLQLAL